MFIKIVFFFLIVNVILGFTVDFLNAAPSGIYLDGRSNTSFFLSENITSANITSSINVTEFHEEQFTPENETGFELPSPAEFFEAIDFLNIGELLEFLDTWNIFFVTQQLDNFLLAVGVVFPPGLVDGIGTILTFAAIMWFLFLIFKVAATSFQ